jgi:hypothetical protein
MYIQVEFLTLRKVVEVECMKVFSTAQQGLA